MSKLGHRLRDQSTAKVPRYQLAALTCRLLGSHDWSAATQRVTNNAYCLRCSLKFYDYAYREIQHGRTPVKE